MTSRAFKFHLPLLGISLLLLSVAVHGQSVALLAPDATESSTEFASRLAERLHGKLRVLDGDLALSAYSSSPPNGPFNMNVEEASRLATVIGSDAVIVVRSGSLRRSSSERPEYYESFAAVFAFGARTGTLLHWQLHSSEGSTLAAAKRLFDAQLGTIAARAESEIKTGLKAEISSVPQPAFTDAAAESERSKEFRPPVPYKRLKPVYTDLASLYDVKATVDAMIYLDEKGEIVRTDVVRWAGFGLDESVVKNIRSMNWRPGSMDGKPIATKFLVRYNFKKGD
jgi:hypothetical protein